MESTVFSFKRYEKKYLLSKEASLLFRQAALPYLKADKHGMYTICNIYYDTKDYELIRNSIEKPVYKEKLRLRSYGIPSKNDTVYIELKKKYQGEVGKRRIALSLADAMNYLEGGKAPETCRGQIFKEIDYFIKRYKLAPSLYLAYDREAWFSDDYKDLRITIDSNIRSRLDNLDLSMGDSGTLLLPSGVSLLEIKTSATVPKWLATILNEQKIYPISFSKYGNVYKNSILPNGGNHVYNGH